MLSPNLPRKFKVYSTLQSKLWSCATTISRDPFYSTMAQSDNAPKKGTTDKELQEKPRMFTTSNGCPAKKPESSPTASNMLLLRDFQLIDLLSHLNRERIPERVVHAKGAGAFGEFEVTHDISDICSIDMLNEIGKKTQCLVRFSTTGGERGSADSVRDARGFAVKCYTEEGNWDWVWNDVPFFFIRDPIKFPGMTHAQKKDPRSNLRDQTRFWNWVIQNPESLHMVMWLYSDYGTFSSYRHMNGYMGHAHKWVMPDGSFKYVHMYLEADLGYKNHSNKDIPHTAGNDPDYAARDLYDAIERGEHPTYTAKVQVIDPADVRKFGYNILDMTKHWDMGTYPTDLGTVGARVVGKLTLNRNPENHFAQIEQAAFSPSHLVPGIEPLEDPMLQARFFAYLDAHRYRLGVNYQQIPVNQPKNAFNPLLRDGAASVLGNYGSHPGFMTPKDTVQFRHFESSSTCEHKKWLAEIASQSNEEKEELDLKFARTFWTHLDDPEYEGWQDRMVRSLGCDIASVEMETRDQVFRILKKIHNELAARVEEKVEEHLTQAKSRL